MNERDERRARRQLLGDLVTELERSTSPLDALFLPALRAELGASERDREALWTAEAEVVRLQRELREARGEAEPRAFQVPPSRHLQDCSSQAPEVADSDCAPGCLVAARWRSDLARGPIKTTDPKQVPIVACWQCGFLGVFEKVTASSGLSLEQCVSCGVDQCRPR